MSDPVKAIEECVVVSRLGASGAMGQGSGGRASEDGLILTAGHVLVKSKPNLPVVFPAGHAPPL